MDSKDKCCQTEALQTKTYKVVVTPPEFTWLRISDNTFAFSISVTFELHTGSGKKQRR